MANWRSTIARKLEPGRPDPVNAPSTSVAYPSVSQRGDASAIGPKGAGDNRSRIRREPLRGRVRWTMCAISCVVSSVAQSE